MNINEFNELIRVSTLEVLGFPDNDTTKSFVRKSWQQNGTPAWGINEDVIFLRAFPVDNPYNRQKDINYQNNDATSVNRIEKYTRVMAVNWILYGPNSYDYADVIRNLIGRNERLQNDNVFLIYDRQSPTRFPENFNGQWWERSDLTLYFNEEVTHEYVTPSISGATVTIKTEGGDIFNGNITP